jgi:prepilin signal peptidase PulO-like enzyme (type II secretory pathway)
VDVLNIYFFIVFFAFGTILGSFLNVLILRIHSDEQWIKERSKCPDCGKELHWYELIPVFSYLYQKGKCNNCQKPISIQYPLIEIASGLLAVLSFVLFGLSLETGIIYLSLFFLLGSFVSDFRFLEIPEIFNAFLLILGIGYQFFIAKSDLFSILVGIGVCTTFFLLQYYLSHKEGLGEGDIRIGFLIGLFLAWPLGIYSILVSYIIASLTFIPLLLVKKVSRKTAIPLGVFLIPVFAVFLIFRLDLGNIIENYLLLPFSY